MARHETTPPRLRQGLVVSHLGKNLAVENDSGESILCHTRRNLGTAAVGDQVLWESAAGNLGRVVKILERRSVLTRPARNHKTRPVAANLDRILIVFAPRPTCDLLLLDQYLVICENHDIQALLLCNKSDLVDESRSLDRSLELYEEIGYPTLRVSAKSRAGLDQLKKALKGHTNMLAGQSGVGKSSLTNALIPDKELRVGELSQNTLHGKHTTTATTLYHLPEGGDLIDSPGVAIFGLANISEQELAFGFREFQPYLDRCRFNDCRHRHDKDCAITAAVEQGSISPERYRRFLKLREKLPPPAN